MHPSSLGRVALVLAIAIAPAAGAQRVTPDPFAPGTRVRVHTRDVHSQVRGSPVTFQDLRGTVVRATRDTLVLDLRPGTAAIPRAGITRMAVSRGAPSRGVNAVTGAVGGAILGGALGAIAAIDDEGGWSWNTVRDWAIPGAAAGLVTGLLWPAEGWRRVPRSVIVGPTAGGGAAAGGRLEF